MKPKDVSKMTQPSDHVNFRFMRMPQRLAHSARKTSVIAAQKRKIQGLEKKLAKFIHEKGVQIDASLHDDLMAIL